MAHRVNYAPLAECRALDRFGLVVSSGTAAQAPEPQKNVLAIYGNRSSLPGNVVVDRTIRSMLVQRFDVGIDIHSEYVDVLPLDQTYPALRDFLRSKYAGKRFDVILAVGDDGSRFVRDYGQELFPGVPIVAWGGREVIENWNSGPPLTGVLEPSNTNGGIKGALGFIRKLQPEAQQLFVVSGASRTDRRFETIARQELGQSQNSTVVTYLAGLPLDDVQKRLTTLPGRSVILFLAMTEDGMGIQLSNRDVLTRIAQTANAPLYALGSVQLGTGIVGSLLVNQERMTQETGEIVIRILRGERVEDIPIRESRPAPAVDWRQLRRWNIPESRLPPGTDLLYKEPSPWDQYKWRIIGVISLCAVEGFLIIALLTHRARRKRAEKAMQESEQLLQSTIDALNAHVVLLDDDCKIIAVNQSWRRFAESNGYVGADKALGRNYLEVCESKMERKEGHLVSNGIRSLLSGELDDFHFVFPGRHSNEESWYQLRVNRFYTDGRMRLVVAHENVTEIKRAHDAQQQLSGLLLRAQDDERRRIARDHAELEQRTLQLRRLASDLTLAEQHVREELAKTLHDGLQQLLFSAVMTLDRAVAGNSQADQVALLQRASADIREAMEAARTLSVNLFPPMLHIGGLPAALAWLAKRTQEQYGVVVNVTADPHANPATSDVRILLFEAVRELLFNAVKHAHVDRIDVSLEVGPDDTIHIHVSDEGVGFDPAATLHHKNHQQVGLGLFSIEERLALFGGHLDIQSAPGKGARFSLTLPRSDLLRLATGARSHDAGWQERLVYDSADGTSKPLRILIADDHVVARAGLRELLSEWPALQVVGEAANGVEAISQAMALQPDVIVMDASMPQMNGIEATREIRGALPHIQIVGLSTHDDEDSARSMREAGAEAYFTKNEGADRLLNYLLSVQTQAKGAAES